MTTIERNEPALAPPWTTRDSARLYRVDAWGRDYFGVNDAGHVVVRTDASTRHEIDMLEVVNGLRERGLGAPVLLRFSDILAHRLEQLHDAFAAAIAENDYTGDYTAVYPIKVNQQRLVVEEVFKFGEAYGLGLEVGSKPELLAVMAMTAHSDRLIVCNGFKDDRYIEAVILASKLGRTVIPVVENFNELQLIIECAQRYDVRPQIGVRVKLATQDATSRWRASAGAKSKFGLFITEIVELFQTLQRHGMEDCLKLVHCHPGSQIQDIGFVKQAIDELAHVYVNLSRMGAGLQYIDVGGGLGVDYDGSQTNLQSSMNYTLREYASDVVYRIASACNEHDVEHPTIISESGRAAVAYHSVLVFDVVGSTSLDRFDVGVLPHEGDDVPPPIRDLHEAFESISTDRLLECYHDALRAQQQALQLFTVGYMTLEQAALAERLFWATCVRIRDLCEALPSIPVELQGLEEILCDTYFCNFSVFQSLPDSWAIDQVFPIMPIHRLDERPTRQAVLADITCDSDGKIDRFVGERGVSRTLDLHPLRANEPYYLAVFLVGAYQETLGDLHNLFGDTHVVHLKLGDHGEWWIEESIRGDSARDVLGYVQHEVNKLYPAMARNCEQAVRAGRMSLAETQVLLRFYESELNGYTYLT